MRCSRSCTSAPGSRSGQPHLRLDDRPQAAGPDALRSDLLGSLHTLEIEGGRAEPNTLFRRLPAEEVLRRYLAEVPALVVGDEPFEIVTHLDYALRYWPAEEIEGPSTPGPSRRSSAPRCARSPASGRALEMNTRRLWQQYEN